MYPGEENPGGAWGKTQWVTAQIRKIVVRV